MTSTAVKWIRHDMRGAPEIKGNAPGALIAAIKALFVTGWGSTTALSVSVEAGFNPRPPILAGDALRTQHTVHAHIFPSSTRTLSF